MPGHTPTSGQLTQLAVLQANVTSTAATQASAFTTYQTALKAAQKAAQDLVDYNHYITGSKNKAGVISGNPDET